MLKKYITYIMFLILGISSAYAQESLNTLIYKGNRSFDKKNYDDASSLFLDAVKRKSNDFGAHYNLGNALYKKKMYEQAAAEYQKAQKLTKNSDEKAASLYNLGNSYLQNGDAEQAVNSYKNALKYDPDNKAIMKNLQIAKKKKEQKQNNNQQNQNNQNQDNKDQQNKNGDNKNKEQKDNNNQNQENGNQGNQNKGQNNQGKLPNQPDKSNSQNQESKIPKDLQKLILERSANQEKETARRLLNKNAYSIPESNEKDW